MTLGKAGFWDDRAVDLPRAFTIREASHRIHNPLTSEKLATLGRALSPAAGTARHARYRREYLGWGVSVLMERWLTDTG